MRVAHTLIQNNAAKLRSGAVCSRAVEDWREREAACGRLSAPALIIKSVCSLSFLPNPDVQSLMACKESWHGFGLSMLSLSSGVLQLGQGRSLGRNVFRHLGLFRYFWPIFLPKFTAPFGKRIFLKLPGLVEVLPNQGPKTCESQLKLVDFLPVSSHCG